MKLTRSDLWSLEDYSAKRDKFRAEVMAHKKHRQVFLGDHATLYFEDSLTMKYQIQEMLRIEKIFNADEIEEELSTYNPLIPDCNNWKATFMLDYPQEQQRRIALEKMGGIEHKVWVQAGDHERTYAIANEDMERTNSTKTAAVHFLRFELAPQVTVSVKQGSPIMMGIDHAELPYEVSLSADNVASLAADLA